MRTLPLRSENSFLSDHGDVVPLLRVLLKSFENNHKQWMPSSTRTLRKEAMFYFFVFLCRIQQPLLKIRQYSMSIYNCSNRFDGEIVLYASLEFTPWCQRGVKTALKVRITHLLWSVDTLGSVLALICEPSVWSQIRQNSYSLEVKKLVSGCRIWGLMAGLSKEAVWLRNTLVIAESVPNCGRPQVRGS